MKKLHLSNDELKHLFTFGTLCKDDLILMHPAGTSSRKVYCDRVSAWQKGQMQPIEEVQLI